MRFASALALASTASAAIVQVKVGSGGLTFSPDSIKAASGDSIEFLFEGGNHSVVQGNFDSPCHPRDQGFFSGYFPTSGGASKNSWVLPVDETLAANPVYIYCATSDHCQQGMVAIINEVDVQGHSLASYKAAAASASENVAPTSATGGSTVPTASVTAGSGSGSGSGSSGSSATGSSAATTTGASGSSSSSSSSGSGTSATSTGASSATTNAAPTFAAGKMVAGLAGAAVMLAL